MIDVNILSEKLKQLTVHGYSGVDPAQVHAAATAGLPDLERFASELSAWVGGLRTAGPA